MCDMPSLRFSDEKLKHGMDNTDTYYDRPVRRPYMMTDNSKLAARRC